MRVGKDIEKIARTFHSGANALLYDASASTEHPRYDGAHFDSLIPRHINRP